MSGHIVSVVASWWPRSKKDNAAWPQGRGEMHVQIDFNLLGCLRTGTLTEPSLKVAPPVRAGY